MWPVPPSLLPACGPHRQLYGPDSTASARAPRPLPELHSLSVLSFFSVVVWFRFGGFGGWATFFFLRRKLINAGLFFYFFIFN